MCYKAHFTVQVTMDLAYLTEQRPADLVKLQPSWTELGARHVGIMHSLIVTCRLHQIDPYDDLVDVLRRVGQHPASRVHELTPRLCKQLFADNPLRCALHTLRA